MALIRQANAADAARSAIVLDLGDIMRQGELIKARAHQEADGIVAAAKRERERLIARAAEEGHREGLERGVREGCAEGTIAGREEALVEFRERLDRLDAAWSAALQRLETERDGILLQARTDVLELAVTMGEMVTKRVIAVEPGAVTDQVAAVLAQLSRPTRLTIRVHPADRAIIERALPATEARFASAQHIETMDDDTLERGSVIASTGEGGAIDASIRTQLDRIVEALIPRTAGPDAGGSP